MNDFLHTLAGGIATAVVVAIIFGGDRSIREWLARDQDVKHLREVVTEGRHRILKAEDIFHKGMNASSTADSLRAAQYNNMIKKLEVALEQWTPNLSHQQRKDVFDALDWYHTAGLPAVKRDGRVVYISLPDGRWSPTEMPLGAAEEKFKALESIKWLKLKPYAGP